jgi:hypothetical protein
MSSMYVGTIVNAIESTEKSKIMVAKSLLSETDIKLIKAFAKDNNKEIIIATMHDICFCKEGDRDYVVWLFL